MEEETGLWVENSLLPPPTQVSDKITIKLTNPTGFTQTAEKGLLLGTAAPATVIDDSSNMETAETETVPIPSTPTKLPAEVRRVTAQSEEWRRQELTSLLGRMQFPDTEGKALLQLLTDNHLAFCLEEGERGETDLVQAHISTGDAAPRRQAMRRMPFTVRQEVAKQLKSMQDLGVIVPSESPWASPVVLVQKKDGTFRFCVDYRELNSLTRPDSYPLPRIDDLLDQLGESKYFSTLDLASGYWQIRMDSESQPKTAFTTPQGLFEFRVMPFGLTNAPAVFQRLMQRALMGLNPEGGPSFVSVYIDDILVFSRTLEDHVNHLKRVIERLTEVGLKLKPTKCFFFRQEVEYLGHIIMPYGLKTNPRFVTAIKEFPTPTKLQEVR